MYQPEFFSVVEDSSACDNSVPDIWNSIYILAAESGPSPRRTLISNSPCPGFVPSTLSVTEYPLALAPPDPVLSTPPWLEPRSDPVLSVPPSESMRPMFPLDYEPPLESHPRWIRPALPPDSPTPPEVPRLSPCIPLHPPRPMGCWRPAPLAPPHCP